MKKEQVEKFFQKYEQFFMQSLIGKLNSDEITELYAPEFIAASPMGVMTGKNDIDLQKTLSNGYEQYRKMGTIDMHVCKIKIYPIDEYHGVAHVFWRASYQKSDKSRVDIDFEVHYLMQEIKGKLRVFGWISGNEQEVLKEYGII